MKTLKDFTTESFNLKDLMTPKELNEISGGHCEGGFSRCTGGWCENGLLKCTRAMSCTYGIFICQEGQSNCRYGGTNCRTSGTICASGTDVCNKYA